MAPSAKAGQGNRKPPQSLGSMALAQRCPLSGAYLRLPNALRNRLPHSAPGDGDRSTQLSYDKLPPARQRTHPGRLPGPRLDLVKIDVEGAEALVWEGLQKTLRRFPQAVVVMELHLQRDPPQIASFLHQLARSGYSLRFVNYDGDVVPIDPATIVANPQEHWMLWLQK
jgi:hypothetical protein